MKNARYFGESDLTNLDKKAVSGGFLVMGSQIYRAILQLLSMMLLARWLTPDDFGLYGMVFVVVAFVTLFKDFGLSQAVIQRLKITHNQVSNLFWISAIISFLLGSLLWVLSPLIVKFYGREELASICYTFALIIFFEGLGLQPRALIMRAMEYKRLLVIECCSISIATFGAIVIAYFFRSYWALVFQVGASSVIGVCLYFIVSGWVPSFFKRGEEIKPFLTYGGYLVGFNMLNFFSRQADNLLIGWKLGAVSLGVYTRAYQLLMLPVSQINSPLTRVGLPSLSRLQDQPDKYRDFYIKAVRILTSLSFPIVFFCVIEAEHVVLVVLGEQWVEAIAIFQALGIAALIGATNITTGWVYQSLGSTDRQFKWTLFAAPVHVFCMYVGLSWGAVGVAWGVSIGFLIIRLPYLIYTYKGTPLCVKDFGVAVRKPFVVSTVASVGLLVFKGAISPMLPDISLVHVICSGLIFGLGALVADILFLNQEGLYIRYMRGGLGSLRKELGKGAANA